MRVERLTVRGFRNLDDLDRLIPPSGVTLLGSNGQGKTNLLEAIAYPTLFRSFRGAADREVARTGGPGFRVDVTAADGDGHRVELGGVFQLLPRRKTMAVDRAEVTRLGDAVGHLPSVVFVPGDVALASGAAADRRRYLDRMLALADRAYFGALARYRAALTQRNSAIRSGHVEVARAFDPQLARFGALIVASRLQWAREAGERFGDALEAIGEGSPAALAYEGRPELANEAEWEPALARAAGADRTRRVTTIGPQRDDLRLSIGHRPLREFGSTGQQRSAAIALKLLELETLRAARQTEPVLILDDVFAELDRDRQRRLAGQLQAAEGRQVLVSAPRRDELPAELDLPVWTVVGGRLDHES